MTSEQVLDHLGVSIPWTRAELSYHSEAETKGRGDLDTPQALNTFWSKLALAFALLLALVVRQLVM